LAKVLPEFVPSAIRNDYEEACLIASLSPKASATLSRRCLQGMIRDFWRISEKTLFQEIDSLKDVIGDDLYNSIDGVRRLGNIGANMKADINVLVDVDEGEAQHLYQLIELLIDEWYVHRDERQKRLSTITALGNAKSDLKMQGSATDPAQGNRQ